MTSPKQTDSELDALPPDLGDEITSINAIFGADTLRIHSGFQSPSQSHSHQSHSTEFFETTSPLPKVQEKAPGSPKEDIVLLLSPPSSHPLHPTSLLMSFPADYPRTTARVLGPYTSDPTMAKGAGHALAQRTQNVLELVTIPEEPVVFALLAELEQALEREAGEVLNPSASNAGHTTDEKQMDPSPSSGQNTISSSSPPLLDSSSYAPTAFSSSSLASSLSSLHISANGAQIPDSRFSLACWTTAAPLESHRSIFVGRAINVRNASDVTLATATLLAEDRHVARATHNIRAWRYRRDLTKLVGDGGDSNYDIVNGSGRGDGGGGGTMVEHQECDDDGESRAGTKVLEVMSAMGAWEVLVVVSRWYGGTKLGPERFRLIGQCVRDVLVLGGYGKDATNKGEDKKSEKEKKKNNRKGK